MKTFKKSLLASCIIFLAAAHGAVSEEKMTIPVRYAGSNTPIVTLDVIRAFDGRLPGLSDEDMKGILDEALRMISAKFGDRIKIEFKDNGTVSLEELFQDKKYRATDIYRQFNSSKYDLKQGREMPLFKNEKFRETVIKFLKQWALDSLRGYFPDKKIENYDDVYVNIMEIYHEKIDWLKTLKTEKGENLVIAPAEPFQSYVEWASFMYDQDKYDIVFTNSLIIYDSAAAPYPHAVCKHAKAGGGAFTSPKREALDGGSMMVSIFEEYGNIDGIRDADKDIPREFKNRILGGFVLAHEFGHAFYRLPDFYDHGDTCLMNSSLSNLDFAEGYKILAGDMSKCLKCQPWIAAKEYIIRGRIAYDNGEYKKAGVLLLKGVKGTLKLIDGDLDMFVDIKLYLKYILKITALAYDEAGDSSGVEDIEKLLDKLDKK
ncbi:MAG: hypothetical protein ABIJ15_07015 [bacterium]